MAVGGVGDYVDASVVLTADNSQYDQAMGSSASTTEALGASIDSLTQKISNLTKSAGRKATFFAAADVATVTAMTAAYGAYEKQVSQLNAQSAVLSRSMEQQKRTMATYEGAVHDLRSEFGTATRDAAALVGQLSKLTDHTAGISNLSRTFTQMSNATGESATTLATSVLNLQRVMGTPQRDTKAYADQLTTLAASSSTSASALADFASQIGPIGRLIGQSQTDITGVAAAFTKAGQEGYMASNAYSKIVSDIAYATQSGSPDLAKYANLVGMTVDQFNKLEGSEKVINIFERLNSLGPSAITELNRMGLDGMRTMRALTAVSQQTGGIGAAISSARQAYGDGSVARGSEASMKGVTDELERLRSEVTQTAEAFGKTFAPVLEGTLKVVEKLAGAFRHLAEGPIGKFVSLIAGAVAPIAALVGGLLLMSGTLAKLGTAALVLGGAPGRGLIEGFRGASTIRSMPDGSFGPAAGGFLGRTGTQIAERGSFLQRGAYNQTARLGGFAGVLAGRATDRFGPGLGARIATSPINAASWGMRNIINPLFSPLSIAGLQDPTQRQRMFNAMRISEYWDPNRVSTSGSRLSPLNPGLVGGQGGAVLSAFNAGRVQREQPTLGQEQQRAALRANTEAADKMKGLSRETGALRESMKGLGGATRTVMGTMASAGASVIGMAGKLSMAALASPLGMMIGIPAAFMAGSAIYRGLNDETSAEFRDMSASGAAYMSVAGLEPPPKFQQPSPEAITMADAREVDIEDVVQAKDASHHLTNRGLYGKNEDETVAYLSTQWDQYKSNAQARQAATLDLIDKFDEQTAESILSRLDSGETPGLESFFETSYNVAGSKEEAGQVVNDAMGMIQDQAANAASAEEGNALRIKGTAEILSRSLDQLAVYGKTTERQDEAFKLLNEQVFQGDVGEGDFYKMGLTKDIEATTRSGVRGLNIYKRTTPSYRAGGASNEETATWILDVMKKMGPGARQSFAGYLGLDYAKIEAQIQEGGTGGFDEIMAALDAADKEQMTLDSRIARGSQTGNLMTSSGLVSGIVNYAVQQGSADPGAQLKAVSAIYGRLTDSGMSQSAMYRDVLTTQSDINDESDPRYQYAAAVRARLDFGRTVQQSLMTRSDSYASSAQGLGDLLSSSSSLTAEERAEASQAFIQQTAEMGQYFQQLLIQQREFNISRERSQEDFGITLERAEEQYNISRSRAQEDYHLQRQYQEHDYQLSRARAEHDYELQRQRGREQFYRSMRRSQQDFDISRRRQEVDYQHSVRLMVEQSAMSMYNVYERIRVQQTASTPFIAFNAQDQLQAMRQQANELDKLREMGLSDDAINKLGLNKTENAQQLTRLVSEATPEMIRDLNKTVQKTLKAARELVQDESSREWKEFERQYSLSLKRAGSDFERATRRAHQDFNIQMDQMEVDFKTSMNRQAEDYETAQDRQQKAFSKSMSRGAEDYARSVDHMTDDFHKSMRRAQEDMDRMADNISSNLVDILTKASNRLSGEVGKQARETLRTFKGLDTALGAAGIDIMTMMSEIFGFKYNPPKINKGGNTWMPGQGSHPDTGRDGPFGGTDQYTGGGGHAEGGVLPGRSIGRDNMHFYSKDHGYLGLAGGEAIMVPEWVDAVGGPTAVDAMNKKARRGFASGGNIPAVGSWNRHPGYSWARWAGDINIPGPSDYGNPVRAWKDGVVAFSGWGGGDSYGNYMRVNHPSTNEETLYAHLKDFVHHAGDKVSRGEIIAHVGSTGNSSGPHLHFEIKGGTGPIQIGGSSSGAGATLASILKDRYVDVEKASRAVMLNGGLFEDGFWSKKLNRYAREVASKYKGQLAETGHGPIPNAPANVDGNIAMGRRMAANRGWVGDQWDALYHLWMGESGWRTNADNPNSAAYGIPQAMTSLHDMPPGYFTNPAVQIRWGLNYIKSAYGTPAHAYSLWQQRDPHWYGNGGLFAGPNQIGVGERGPEMVLPLNETGASFVADIFRKTQVGAAGRGTNLVGSQPIYAPTMNSYSIDRSTTFSGAITVQANNPGELIAQLRQRQRVMALSQASLGGKRT